MKSTLILILLICLAATSASAEEMTNIPSPDGRFALFMGTWEARHFDNKTQDWVTDSIAKPAAIIELKSGKVLLQLNSPLRPDEDHAVWNAASSRLAVSHRGNKITDIMAFELENDSFRELRLPELPEVEIKVAPPPNPKLEPHLHFNHDNITPLRWLKSGALVISRDKSVTDTTAQEVSYQRTYVITVDFNVKHEGVVKDVTRQKQSSHASEN